MLRTLVLLVTHLSMLGAGVGLAGITLRGRRQALVAKGAALDTHEMFLNGRADQMRRGVFPAVPDTTPRRSPSAPTPGPGRHRAGPRTVVPKPPRLLKAGLAEAVAVLATQRAIREQERRAFVDLMLGAGMRTWVQASARVSMPA